jgi:flagellar biosynthesis/type III secretory pathway M-ring protein FliF/YscJ
MLTSTSTATTTPSPAPTAPDPNSVTPGFRGFLVVFLLAIVVWLLMRNMTRRLRRMRLREEQAQRDADAANGRPDDDPSR